MDDSERIQDTVRGEVLKRFREICEECDSDVYQILKRVRVARSTVYKWMEELNIKTKAQRKRDADAKDRAERLRRIQEHIDE